MQKTMHFLNYVEVDESGLDDDLEEFSEMREDDELEYDEEQY